MMIPEPVEVTRPASDRGSGPAAASAQANAVTPKRRDGRSLPPA